MSADKPLKIIDVLIAFVIMTALSVATVYELLVGVAEEQEKRHPSSTERPHE